MNFLAPGGFDRVERSMGSGYAFLHKSAPVWIVEYSVTPREGVSSWGAYVAIVKVPKGRMPWTVDNKRVCELTTDFGTAVKACADRAESMTPPAKPSEGK